MTRWPQREHASTWPPSAAVRHRVIATNTLTCNQVSQAGCRSMSLCPAARMISANSRSGRFILFVAVRKLFRVWRSHQPERVQGAGGGFEMPLGKMQVAAGGFQIRMTQQELNGAKVGAGFE